MSARDEAKVVIRLAAAAERLREDSGDDPFRLRVADWLYAESEHAKVLLVQQESINVLIATSDATGDLRSWRIKVGYSTQREALALADEVLGVDDEAGDPE